MNDLDVAIAAGLAGAAAIRGAGGDLDTRMKGVVDPVTAVDLAAERAVLGVIGEHRPHDAVLSEEGGGSDDPGAGRLWVVDPMDGTVNFIHRVEHVSVSVGLWVDDTPEVGVVVDVFRQRVFAAQAGRGATVDGVPMRVNDRPPAESLIAIGFPYDRQERADTYGEMVARVLADFRDARRFGSAALDLAWVAEGRVDGYTEVGLQPWDVAAGILLVREAGGVVLDEHGGDAGLRSRSWAAGSPALASRLVDVITPAIAR